MRAPGVLFLLMSLLCVGRALAGEDLGMLEREALEEVMESRGFTPENAPDGKIIGHVHIVNLPVFSRRDSFFQLFNIFHRTTREYVIRREALFRSGDRFNHALVSETVRNLQDSSFTNVVVVVPVKTTKPETVDVLIVTRDVWSLRFNTDWEYQQGQLVFLTASLSENNLFGWRKHVAAVFDLTQGSAKLGPTYSDPNIAGTRLSFRTSAMVLFSRTDGDMEGSSSYTQLGYPLYSLASRWGASLAFEHENAIRRQFLGDNLRTYDLQSTTEVERLPWVYRVRRIGLLTTGVRSFRGNRLIHRVGAGHRFSVVRPSFTDEFPADAAARDSFATEVFPLSERTSSLFSSYALFTPTYRTYRDLQTFDLREDLLLGPKLAVTAERAFTTLGSDRAFFSFEVDASWACALTGGLERLSINWSARLFPTGFADKQYRAEIYWASPLIGNAMRLIGNAGFQVLVDDTRNSFFSLGGTSGLRGYTIGDFVGKAQALVHIEGRTRPLAIGSQRMGATLFYDVGDAATPEPREGNDFGRIWHSLRVLRPHHDFGAGLRWLIPQLNTYVLRLDWAFATSSTPNTRAGWPGRVSFGFRQIF